MDAGMVAAMASHTTLVTAETHDFAHHQVASGTTAGRTEIQGAAALVPQYPWDEWNKSRNKMKTMHGCL